MFVPEDKGDDNFSSMEEMNNYLLAHPEFYDLVQEKGPGGKAVLVMFDEETERLAGELGIQVALPPAELRHRMDSKLVTTRMGNEAGVPSVPNVLGTVDDYDGLVELARGPGSATTWSCSCPGATRARPRSSSPTGAAGTPRPTTTS